MSPTSETSSTNVTLRCVGCDATYPVDMTVHCRHCGPRAFLRSEYDPRTLELAGPPEEFASYRSWLPFEMVRNLPSLRIGCVSSPDLAREMGLSELWLLVSGFAPEVGADLPTCTFKTLEAVGVMLRVLSYSDRTLIVSSAGNAGCAVLEFGARWNVPAVVVVPESAAPGLYTSVSGGDRAPLLICLRGATYPDAIAMVGRMTERFGERVVREGGAYNVARRDSMGVPVLRAAQAMGKIPDHYFQAVGSGTGGIAAHEAATRLAAAGFPGGPMRLHLVQNVPFTPMVDAWTRGADEVAPMSREDILERLAQTYTSVLANSTPPYGVRGGVRDVLRESGGDMIAVTNDEARAGHDAIADAHGFDPFAEAGAAFAALRRAVAAGDVGADESVLVHLTGAGWAASIDDLERRPYAPHYVLDADDTDGAAEAIGAYLDRVCAD